EINVREAALSNIHVSYHRESGFIGHKIKAEDKKKDIEFACSELDRILVIFNDGIYKVSTCRTSSLLAAKWRGWACLMSVWSLTLSTVQAR
ncbi:MAG: hypothetical protein D3903_19410, partial [Candidatus Electrothrix sp. GM3_4]|nr:hypothetical protein [Candidatus Electrothrix sp. GM3_4]